jgi:hypothetical protein
MTRVIVTAAGEGTRWGNHRGVPKHLLPSPANSSETLLGRIVRQCLDYDARLDVVVSGPRHYAQPGARIFTPTYRPNDFECSIYTWTSELWNQNGRTVYLYGDTFYTDAAIATILGFTPEEWHLFARFKESSVTGKPWPEVWSHSFWPEQINEEVVMITGAVEARHRFGYPRASIYEMYKERFGRLVGGFSYDQTNLGAMTEIDDWTEDFDFPKDYDLFCLNYARAHA